MVEFFEQYGADILAMITGLAGLIGSVWGIVRVFKSEKSTGEKIKATREGIIEGFKAAKIPNEWKVDVSNKINITLSKWRDDLLSQFKKDQALTNELTLYAIKILSHTAASNMLTDEEKARVDELIKLVGEDDKTIDITE